MAYRKNKAIKRKVVRKAKKAAPRYKQVSTVSNIPRMQRFRWVSNFTLNPDSTNTLGVIRFRCNDPTRPDGSDLHQPLRWRRTTNFYQEYLCIGAKITVTRVNSVTNSLDGIPQVWGIFLDNDQTIISPNYQQLMEQGRGKHRLTSSANSYGNQRISMGFSTKKYFNLHDLKDNWAQFGAETLSTPNKKAWWVVYVQNLNPTEDVFKSHYMVSIDYSVLFSKPREILD